EFRRVLFRSKNGDDDIASPRSFARTRYGVHASFLGAKASPRSRPCESRDPYAVSSRLAAAYGSRLRKRVYAGLRRAMGRDDRYVCMLERIRGNERMSAGFA